MTFKNYRNKLNNKRYNPISKKELNQLVIQKKDLNKVANSVQRMVVQVISNLFNFDTTQDSLLFELVQVGNEYIAKAINEYNHDKIDFAFYCYIHILNGIKTYLKNNSHIVRSSVVDKKRYFADYFWIDEPIDDEDGQEFDLEYEEELIEDKIDFDFILQLIKENAPLFREYYLDIYKSYLDFDGRGLTAKEIALEHGITTARIYQVVNEVIRHIKNNKKIIKYLSQF
jgi:RNA polymerase sigma factor (sigma-70 family)